MNRRHFLAWTAASYSRILGANDRIGLALIGSGRRGREVATHFLRSGGVRLAGIADVYDVQRKRALDLAGFKEDNPKQTVAIEEALAWQDVDAVLIGTPDHHHVTQAKAALAAGKHVYLEKPTLHRWDERPVLEAAVRASAKVLQCGMQQRSGAHYRQLREEFFDKGKLGNVVLVRAVWHDFPWQRRKIEPTPRPAGLDWERFLGPAPKRSYEAVRYDSWRYFPDYGGGLLADILTHWVDVAQWLMNDASPLDAVSSGGIYVLKDGRENPDTVSALLRYKNWNLSFESTVLSVPDKRPGVTFEGTEGLLEVTRGGYVWTLREGEPRTHKFSGSLDADHVANFLQAVRDGKGQNAPLEVGLEATVPVQMALSAYRTRNRITRKQLG